MEFRHHKHRFTWPRSIAAVLAAAALLTVTPTASAQTVSPTDDQYDSTLELVSQGGRGPGEAAGPSSEQAGGEQPGGALPFTGLDIAGLLAAAAALGGSGLVLRRLSRRRAPSDGQIS